MRILLLGGSKSGKSMLAQALSRNLAQGGPLYYWATMEPVDQEDTQRIARHLKERDGWGFITVEAGWDLLSAADRVRPDGTVLFDSVTACLANGMFSGGFHPQAHERAARDLLALSGRCRHFVCVCDELWEDCGGYGPETEAYCRSLALICRRLAKEFDAVCQVTAGLPRLWKGALLPL